MNCSDEILLPYQKAWIADKRAVVIGEKGRRTGLTWTEALAQVLIACSAKDAGGMNCFYLAYNKDMTKDFIQTCSWWAKALNIAAEEEEIWPDPQNPEKDILVYQIRFASGFYIQALPSKKTALRSKQGRACIDEAAFVEDFDELLKSALSLTMWGGQLRIISTHDGYDNPFNLLILDVLAGRRPYGHQRIPFDEAVEQGLYKRICLQIGKEWSLEDEKAWVAQEVKQHGEAADEELFCIPGKGTGRYFPRSLLEQCSLPQKALLRKALADEFLQENEALRRATIKEYFEDYVKECLAEVKGYCYGGLDFARSGDLSVLWFFEQEHDLELNSLFVLEMRNWPFSAQEQLIELVLEELGRLLGGIAFDARGNGQQLAEYFALEFPGFVHEVMISRKWYGENFPKLKARFEDRGIIIPRDTYILDDLREIVLDRGIPMVRERTKDVGKGNLRHGDAAIAACLAVFAANNDEGGYVPCAYESVGKREW